MCPVCKNQFEKTISQHKRVYCSEDCKYLARKIRKELKLRKEDLDLEGNLNLKLKRQGYSEKIEEKIEEKIDWKTLYKVFQAQWHVNKF